MSDTPRTRRGNRESWISAEPNPRGYYEAKVWMGLKANGQPDRRHIQRKSLAEVRREVRRLERMRDTGLAGRPGKAPTVQEMLTRHLTVVLTQRGRAPRTIADYWSKCRNDIFPRWGAQRVDRLTPEHIEEGLAAMLDAGHAPSHVRKVLAILSSAYEVQAKRAQAFGMPGGTTMVNPCKFVEPPEIGEANRKVLTVRQSRAVLNAARERGQFARWAVGLGLGLRQGEALGLRWQFLDIDAPEGEDGEARVWAQLQRLTWEHGCDDPAGCTAQARRCPRRKLPRGSIRLAGALVLREKVKEKKRKTVPVPAPLCAILREHRSAQFEQRMLAGGEWDDRDLVFARWDGSPVDPRRDWQEWARILEAAGIPHAGVHAGRHTAITIAVDEGVAITAVQQLAGHTSVTTTEGYDHSSSPGARIAARAVSKALFEDPE